VLSLKSFTKQEVESSIKFLNLINPKKKKNLNGDVMTLKKLLQINHKDYKKLWINKMKI
jgi:hypothetical protein